MRRRTVLATVPVGLLARLDHTLAVPAPPTTIARQLGAAVQYRRARQLFDGGQLAQLIDAMPDLLVTAHADAATHEPAAYAQLTACYTLWGSVILLPGLSWASMRLVRTR